MENTGAWQAALSLGWETLDLWELVTYADNELNAGPVISSADGSYVLRCLTADHWDSSPSFHLSSAPDGDRLLAFCHGCDLKVSDVQAFLEAGKPKEGVGERNAGQRGSGGPSEPRKLVARYRFTSGEHEGTFTKLRFDPKGFSWSTPYGGSSLGFPGKELDPYLAPFPEGRIVWVVEGERDADRLVAHGLVATTAGAGIPADLSSLRGKSIVLCGDNDAKGQAIMASWRAKLELMGCAITQRWPKAAFKDVTDHLDAGYSLDELLTEATELEEELAEDADTRAGLVDLAWLMDQEDIEPEWVLEPFVQVGKLVAIVGSAKAGKSLFAQEAAVAVASGRPFLGREVIRRNVLYVDFENTQEDWRERLHAFNAPHGVPGLYLLSYPSWEKLDTKQGGLRLLEAVIRHQIEWVIIDTAQRTISGAENDREPWGKLYDYALMPLKAMRVAITRLDHLGKDVSRGVRGSSAKWDDIDAAWSLVNLSDDLEEEEPFLELTRTHSRQRGLEGKLSIQRLLDPLRHEELSKATDASHIHLMVKMKQAGVTAEHSRREAEALLKAAGVKARTAKVLAVLREWKASKEASEGGSQGWEPPSGAQVVPKWFPGTEPLANLSVKSGSHDWEPPTGQKVVPISPSLDGNHLGEGSTEKVVSLDARRGSGVCRDCGGPTAMAGFVYCSACAKKRGGRAMPTTKDEEAGS